MALLQQAREALVRRPVLVPAILGTHWEVGRCALPIADASLELLVERGIAATAIAEALLHYTMGAVEAEAHARWNATFEREIVGSVVSAVDGSPLDLYPNLLRYGPATDPSDRAPRFRFELTTIIDGLPRA